MAEIQKLINIAAIPPIATASDSAGVTVLLPVQVTESANYYTPDTYVDTQLPHVNVNLTGLGEENIPDPRLFKFLSDRSGVSDKAVASIFKHAVDTLSALDTVDNKSLIKQAVSPLTASEEASLNLLRELVDSFTYISTTSLDLAANKVSEVSLLTELTTILDKLLVSTGTISDQVSRDISVVFREVSYFFGNYVSGDYTNKSVYISDRLVSLVADFRRDFYDTVDASDDFYGAANLDDDQTAQAIKVANNTVFGTDEQSFHSETNVEVSQAVMLDTSALEVTSRYVSSTVVASAALLAPTKNNVDGVVLTSEHTLAASNVLSSTATSTDLGLYGLDKINTDTAIPSDQAANYIDKSITLLEYFYGEYTSSNYSANPDFTVADKIVSLTSQFNRGIHDIVSSTDDFYGAASIDDDQIALVSKYLHIGIDSLDTQQFSISSTLASDIRSIADYVYSYSTKEASSNLYIGDLHTLSHAKQVVSVLDTADLPYTYATKVLASDIAHSDMFSATAVIQAPNQQAVVYDNYTSSLSTAHMSGVLSEDGGLINTQDYFFGEYVTPGYVGINTYF
jgi:hypothetical protein